MLHRSKGAEFPFPVSTTQCSVEKLPTQRSILASRYGVTTSVDKEELRVSSIWSHINKALDTASHNILLAKLERWIWWVDCSVGKELAGWVHPESSDQWPSAWMETRDQSCHPGVHIWTSTVYYLHQWQSGIKWILGKLANDPKLCGVVGTCGEWDAIQRNLDKLEDLACVSLLRFNKTKCKVLHHSPGNPWHQHRLGEEEVESSPGDKT